MRRPPAGTGIPIEGLTNEEENSFPMDTQQISAPSRASSGVVHDNSRHTSRFTVVGNHLTQHRELSLTAIGLAAHIQSLPAGARPFPVGHPQSPVLTLQALVAGPHNMPVIKDVAEARKDLALATLAAITHAGDPDIGAILKTLSTALRDVPETIADPIVELTAQGLGNRPAAQQWRNLVAVDLSFYKSPLSEEIRDEGRAEGREEGRAEGIARGILLLLAQVGVDVPGEARERITGCADLDLLSRWLLRAPTATSIEDVFAEK
jgi:hypothetical protein